MQDAFMNWGIKHKVFQSVYQAQGNSSVENLHLYCKYYFCVYL